MSRENLIKEIHNKYSTNKIAERINIAALISERAKQFSNELVVVGGSAVEFYTAASYMTSDLDFIARDDFKIAEIMNSLGFNIDNQYIWSHPDTNVIIEFPKAPLAGDINRVQEIETEYGKAKIIGIEDIILDRIKGRVFWQDDNEWPEYMLYTHYDSIDFDYLLTESKKELVDKAVEKMIEDVKAYKSGKISSLRDLTYSDSEVEAKILSKLENDAEIDDIIFELCIDKLVKGKDLFSRRQYLKEIVKKSSEIQAWLKD
ncbi:MAG: hypothetical protein Q4D21_00515 [Phascolarctobacterium sp.]|nr:hypothetical protein [Phascolarctobacterium sp.]